MSYPCLRAVALPPLRPAAFFCAVVPPCEAEEREEPECDFLPPRLEAPHEFAIFAARSFDIPFSLRASYCFSFLTCALLRGIRSTSSWRCGVPETTDRRYPLRRRAHLAYPACRGAKSPCGRTSDLVPTDPLPLAG